MGQFARQKKGVILNEFMHSPDKDLLLVAKDDELGRQIQDLDLLTRKRASKRNG